MPRIYQLPPEALRLDASAGARWLAVALLDEVRATIPRIADPGDTEALHDFRVEVRRLRACLRAYAPLLGGAGTAPCRRELRSISNSTSEARDAEVQLEWIALLQPSLPAEAAAGVAWVVEHLTDTKISGYLKAGRTLTTELPAVESALRGFLEVAPSGETEPFTQYLWRAVVAHSNDLEGKLLLVTGMFDEATAHRARISAKRLRYLIEPLVTGIPFTQTVADQLAQFQDLVGALRDRQMMGHVVRKEIEALRSDRDRWFDELSSGTGGPAHRSPPQLAGLLALARASRCEQEQLYGPLERDWLGPRADSFFKSVHQLAERISLIIPQLI